MGVDLRSTFMLLKVAVKLRSCSRDHLEILSLDHDRAGQRSKPVC